jgi:hypothetical protein
VADGLLKPEILLECSPTPDIGRVVPPFVAVFILFPLALGPLDVPVAVAVPHEMLPELVLGDVEGRFTDRLGLGDVYSASMLSNRRACSTTTTAIGFSPFGTRRNCRFQAALVLKCLGTFSQPWNVFLQISRSCDTILLLNML